MTPTNSEMTSENFRELTADEMRTVNGGNVLLDFINRNLWTCHYEQIEGIGFTVCTKG